jgi:hypothetical protein
MQLWNTGMGHLLEDQSFPTKEASSLPDLVMSQIRHPHLLECERLASVGIQHAKHSAALTVYFQIMEYLITVMQQRPAERGWPGFRWKGNNHK